MWRSGKARPCRRKGQGSRKGQGQALPVRVNQFLGSALMNKGQQVVARDQKAAFDFVNGAFEAAVFVLD